MFLLLLHIAKKMLQPNMEKMQLKKYVANWSLFFCATSGCLVRACESTNIDVCTPSFIPSSLPPAFEASERCVRQEEERTSKPPSSNRGEETCQFLYFSSSFSIDGESERHEGKNSAANFVFHHSKLGKLHVCFFSFSVKKNSSF